MILLLAGHGTRTDGPPSSAVLISLVEPQSTFLLEQLLLPSQYIWANVADTEQKPLLTSRITPLMLSLAQFSSGSDGSVRHLLMIHVL